MSGFLVFVNSSFNSHLQNNLLRRHHTRSTENLKEKKKDPMLRTLASPVFPVDELHYLGEPENNLQWWLSSKMQAIVNAPLMQKVLLGDKNTTLNIHVNSKIFPNFRNTNMWENAHHSIEKKETILTTPSIRFFLRLNYSSLSPSERILQVISSLVINV